MSVLCLPPRYTVSNISCLYRFGQDGTTADDRYILGPTKAERIEGLAQDRAAAYARDLKEAEARHARNKLSTAPTVNKLDVDAAYNARQSEQAIGKRDRTTSLEAMQTSISGRKEAYQQKLNQTEQPVRGRGVSIELNDTKRRAEELRSKKMAPLYEWGRSPREPRHR